MQDRYAGDIGDFGKFAVLGALAPGRRLGVGWYLTSGAGEANNDGRHLAYLEQADRFEHLAPIVFSSLRRFVQAFRARPGSRSVASLERLGLLPDSTRFHCGRCPPAGPARAAWSSQLVQQMRGADLVFLDPDNGFQGAQPSHKSVGFNELQALRAPGRALLVYHHQTRRRGGAGAEVAHQRARLQAHGFKDMAAVRLKPYSSRFYFLLEGGAQLRRRLARFAAAWGEEAVLFD